MVCAVNQEGTSNALIWIKLASEKLGLRPINSAIGHVLILGSRTLALNGVAHRSSCADHHAPFRVHCNLGAHKLQLIQWT
jgi:hypothetical protein